MDLPLCSRARAAILRTAVLCAMCLIANACRVSAEEADEESPGIEALISEPARQELLDFYAAHKDEWAFPASVKWRQIVVQRRPDESREAAEKRARELLAQLKEGADFAELARQHSIGATRDKGGYWNWSNKGSPACEEDEEFLFTGKIGSTSDVLPYGDEFHIVRILDRREAGYCSFKKAAPMIRERLISQRQYDPEFSDSMVVATVNSVPITVGEVLEPFEHHLETRVKPLLFRGRHSEAHRDWGKQRLLSDLAETPINQEPTPAGYNEIRGKWVQHFLPDVIDRKLRVYSLLSDLTAEQRTVLDEYLDKAWQEYTVRLRKERGVSTLQELADDMNEEGADLASVERRWREGRMAHQFKLLRGNSSYEPTSEELHDYYDGPQSEWGAAPRVRTFEEVEAEIRDKLKNADRERRARQAVREFADKAVIKTVFGDEWKFVVPSPDDASADSTEQSDAGD